MQWNINQADLVGQRNINLSSSKEISSSEYRKKFELELQTSSCSLAYQSYSRSSYQTPLANNKYISLIQSSIQKTKHFDLSNDARIFPHQMKSQFKTDKKYRESKITPNVNGSYEQKSEGYQLIQDTHPQRIFPGSFFNKEQHHTHQQITQEEKHHASMRDSKMENFFREKDRLNEEYQKLRNQIHIKIQPHLTQSEGELHQPSIQSTKNHSRNSNQQLTISQNSTATSKSACKYFNSFQSHSHIKIVPREIHTSKAISQFRPFDSFKEHESRQQPKKISFINSIRVKQKTLVPKALPLQPQNSQLQQTRLSQDKSLNTGEHQNRQAINKYRMKQEESINFIESIQGEQRQIHEQSNKQSLGNQPRAGFIFSKSSNSIKGQKSDINVYPSQYEARINLGLPRNQINFDEEHQLQIQTLQQSDFVSKKDLEELEKEEQEGIF